METGMTHEAFEPGNRQAIGDQKTPGSIEPQALEIRIVNESVGSAWRVRPVFEIIDSAIPQQSLAIGVEEDG